MKLPLLLSVMILFVSCTVIYFDQPQPKTGRTLKTVPDKLIGIWGNKQGDSIIITKKGGEEIFYDTDSLGNTKRTTTKYFLSDSLILKKTGNQYVLNKFNKQRKKWSVLLVLKKSNSGDINSYYPFTSPYFGKIDTATFKKPSFDDFMDLLDDPVIKSDYKGNLKKRDIKKVISPENIFFILYSDSSLPERKADTIHFDFTLPIK